MQNMMLDLIEQFGYLGVFLLITIENVFPPIPSELVLTFGGFMTTQTNLGLIGVILAATAGSVLGAIILYGVGRLLSTERLERFTASRLGRLLRLKKSDIRRAEARFQKHGGVTIFFCRFIPVIRSLISIPAGTTKMPLPGFIVLTTLGTLVWNTVLVILGRFAGHAWHRIADYVDLLTYGVLAVIVVLALYYGYRYIKARSKKAEP
jgi:membrane protein DedA with SNARE-associated domain